jgi:hypothetical protein
MEAEVVRRRREGVKEVERIVRGAEDWRTRECEEEVRFIALFGSGASLGGKLVWYVYGELG